jgi:predicted glycogen debranching enzyme
MITRPTDWSTPITDDDVPEEGAPLSREWLVTNGLGGFASGTIPGIPTRRYHGLLVAALPAPLGRTLMLNHLREQLTTADGITVSLSEQETKNHKADLSGFRCLQSFHLEMGLPVWRYETGGVVWEKKLFLPYQQNTVHIRYQLISARSPARLTLHPAVHFRPQEASVDQMFVPVKDYVLSAHEDFYELRGGDFPPLRLRLQGRDAAFIDRRRCENIFFRLENARGYSAVGEYWSPGAFSLELQEGESVVFTASTESAETLRLLPPHEAYEVELKRRHHLLEMAPPCARSGVAGELVLAADQFIVTPAGRVQEAALAKASGEEIKTIIAGYHWFTDWGRDTMISLEGLTLATGRHHEARYILRTFANYVRDGLIPNMFPEHDKHGLYHTADATLWFFHALHRYLQVTHDQETLRAILPKLVSIVEHHLHGTLFNIRVDARDGLLYQGKEGYQLTWMDAKVNDWVVTPRRGKAVELNALWYNALQLLASWLDEEDPEQATVLREHAGRARVAFNERFWYEQGGYLYDVIDGPQGVDTACRPNQIFAIALDYPILEPQYWPAVLQVVQSRLLTPVGLRSLARGHPEYKACYKGDLVTRDAAYHQGTVWGWLIGSFIDAWLKVNRNDLSAAKQFLTGFEQHLGEAGIGTISEIFDAEEPFMPRGCIAQAWSVAEVLRCLVKCGDADAQGSGAQHQ